MIVALVIVAGLVGVLVGGVINALADDLPARRNPRRPHYPDGTLRPTVAWLGIGAYLNGQRLGWRYPLVEIVTGLGFMGLVLGFREEPRLWVWLAYVAILILITVIDIEHRLILFVVIVPSCLFALVIAIVFPAEDRSTLDYIIGGIAGFLLFYLMFLGGVLFSKLAGRNEVAFGFGDVMLATLSGLMLGWQPLFFTVMITVFAGAIGALGYVAVRSVLRHSRFAPFPYGPYIVLGTLIMMLFNDEVIKLFG